MANINGKYVVEIGKDASKDNSTLTILENEKSLGRYIIQKYGDSTAVYGYGIVGKHLCNELKRNEIKINPAKIHEKVPIYVSKDQLPQDVTLIVTAMYYYGEIEQAMVKKGIKKIISIEKIINECLTETVYVD